MAGEESIKCEKYEILKENIMKKFTGGEDLVKNMIIALLAGGHILIEDVPGVGKTTAARAVADSLKCEFARIQFTPDTMPSDLVGTTVFVAQTGTFRMVKGPVFHNIILADEINRTSPKTQSALLESMEERQVSIDGTTYPLPEPFIVIATQNPIDQVGTYPLPEAQLDRFMMKLSVGYPDRETSVKLAERFLGGILEEELTPVLNVQDVLQMQKEVRGVKITGELIEYATSIVEETRRLKELRYGLSPRAELDLLRASQSCAYISGRDYVIPEDITDMARVVLPHRMVPTAEARMSRMNGKQLITNILKQVRRPM